MSINWEKCVLCQTWKYSIRNILSCITRAENKTEIVIRAFYYIALDKWQRSDVNLVWLNSFINLMFVCLVNLPNFHWMYFFCIIAQGHNYYIQIHIVHYTYSTFLLSSYLLLSPDYYCWLHLWNERCYHRLGSQHYRASISKKPKG